jgi:Escherichia/Staphylococcus phage prohead protease
MPPKSKPPAIERSFVPLEDGQIELRTISGAPPRIAMFVPFNRTYEHPAGFRETIRPGAFAKSIGDKRSAKEGRDIVALWNHDPNWVLGRQANHTLEVREGATGLEAEAILDPQDAMHQHFARRIERGDVRGASFGFEAREVERGKAEDGTPTRALVEVQLFDVSPVTFPAYTESTSHRRSADLDVASVQAGVDLSELSEILAHVRDGKAPPEAREKFLAHVQKLQGLVPPAPIPPVDWRARTELRERFLRAMGDMKMASVDGTEHPSEDFALVPDPAMPSTWKLPIFDKVHVQNALARLNQTEIPAGMMDNVKRKLKAAAEKFGVDAASLGEGRSVRMYTRPSDGKTYDTFEACVADNQWADSPEGYCNTIKTGGE